MRKNVLKSALLTMVFCFLALPAHALLYHFSSANDLGSWTSTNLSTNSDAKTSLNLYRLNVRSGPVFSTEQGITTWSRLFFRHNSNRLGAFTIQDSTHDVLDIVYPNTDGEYYSDNLGQFETGQDEGPQSGVAPVPEPGTLFLIGSGLSGLLLYRKKRAS